MTAGCSSARRSSRSKGSIGPLERWARINLRPLSQAVADQEERTGRVTTAAIAEAAGVARATVTNWRTGGGVPVRTADRVACRLGLHPIDIWPDWYETSGTDY